MYHYKLEKVATGVKVIITEVKGTETILDGATYANDTATTSEFTTGIKNDGISGMQYNTKRYYGGMSFDNMKVYAPAK